MRCQPCQHESPAGARFCPECGARLGAVCAQCGPVHRGVVGAIEAREPERTDENAAFLAYHWDEADGAERVERELGSTA